MKKLFLSILILLASHGLVIAEPSTPLLDPTNSVTEITTTGVYTAKSCTIVKIKIVTDGTNDATLILHDSASAASGNVIDETTVIGADHYGFGGPFPGGRRVFNGIYGTISGTGASCFIDVRWD